ncbi:superoxide dismutase family protein [Saccharopolyspora sp. HNM0983]|uniref:Superoxide dismutase family protein n=1 Tax=Saccharopolyspora montiporae TaxID=2781240 RepID=A0A929BB04_9PSEU|nr:superoxide dismutase family protein [Saccharopolyspora sp. HNM0983]MBE9374803.1 superoxide dismutase family protein [Saccharopolyspora sp. HNM0983]
MVHQRKRLLGPILGAFAAASLLVGCGQGEEQGQPPAAEQPPPAEPEQPEHGEHGEQPAAPEPGQQQADAEGTFEPFQEGATAVTYDEQQAPPGSTAKVRTEALPDGGQRITTEFTGLQPDREYGAHVHTQPCGPSGDDAGPHFQQEADPVKPSVDPAFANPENEVWLDFHTDAEGNGQATAEGAWQFEGRDDANSLVIHQEHTHTEPGEAGEAGDRLACLTASF